MQGTDVQILLPRPHPGQLRVIREARRFNVLECGRRFGKTTLGERLLVKTAVKNWPVAWFAPTYKLLADVWREFVRLLSPAARAVNTQERRIELTTGGVIDFWSLDQPDAGRGRKYKRVAVDEAGIVRNLREAWQAAIRPTLTDFKGDAFFLGTPKGRGYFHELFAKGQGGDPEWRSWRLPSVTNPRIDPSEIEAARRDMPEAAFNQEFLGIPADDGGNPFGIDAIRRCAAGISNAPPKCWGIDLAKSHDWCVACALDDAGRVCRLERWQSDWGQTRRRILDLIGDRPALVDQTGVGNPVVEDLRRERGRVEGYTFTAQSKQLLMEGLAAAIQRGEVSFPDGWLVGELEAFEFTYYAGGVRYTAPEGLHDDGVCALALAVQKRHEMRGARIRMVGSPTVAVG